MKRFIVIALIVTATLSGCSIKISSSAIKDGGIWRSPDKGETWEQRVYVRAGTRPDRPVTISDVNTITLAMSPADSRVLYIGSRENGLLYSTNAGEQWFQSGIKSGRVETVAIDPKKTDIVYISMANVIFKSTDAGHDDWTRIYTDEFAAQITHLTVDPITSATIYAAMIDGRLLQSINGGDSWQVLHNFEQPLAGFNVITSPRTMYAFLQIQGGVAKSVDNGATWNSYTEQLKEYRGAIYQAFAISPKTAYFIGRAGLIKTVDGGANWTSVPVLGTLAQTEVYAFGVNPSNPKELYYTTAGRMYRTVNGGTSWENDLLPSKRVGSAVVVDWYNPAVVYLGVAALKKK